MIECMKFISNEKGSFRGFFDIYIQKWDLEIYGCKLFMKDGKRWVGLPTREYLDAQGEKKYAPYMRFRNKDLQDQFNRKVIEAIEKHCASIPLEGSAHPVPEEQLPF